MGVMTERRRTWRTEIALECTLHRRTGKTIEAQTLDIGPGGMRIRTNRPLSVDEVLEFELPDRARVNGDDYLIVASKGGADAPPAWYLNLKANPEVEVQVKGDRFKAHARDATPEEKPELWKTMTAEWPSYDEYQTKTERPIPVVVLERD